MEFNYEVTEEDYIKFNIYHGKNSPSQRKILFILRYIFPIIMAPVIYFVGLSLTKESKIYWGIIALAYVIVWVITYPKQREFMMKKQIKKLLSEGSNALCFGSKKIIIDDKSINIINDELSSETIAKKNIIDVKVNEDMILIYVSSFMAHIVPRRCLDEQAEKNLLRLIGK